MNSWLTTNGQIKIIFKQVKYEETFLEIFSNPVARQGLFFSHVETAKVARWAMMNLLLLR